MRCWRGACYCPSGDCGRRVCDSFHGDKFWGSVGFYMVAACRAAIAAGLEAGRMLQYRLEYADALFANSIRVLSR